MFWFSRARVSMDLSFWVQNSTRLLYLPIPSSAETWNIFTNKMCNFFFSLKLTSEKNPYFGKHLFAKQELITRARLGVQDLRTGKNFCFNQYHKKEFLSFFSVKLFYKRNRKLFSCVCIALVSGWANCRQLCKPRDEVEGLHNCLEFSQPLECLYQAMQTRKTFSVA